MTVIDKSTFPLLPTTDTQSRMRHFPQSVYATDESSTLYKYIDALVGDSGAGGIKKQLLISRLNQKLDTTFFTDLDRVFGNLGRITRTVAESYTIDPSTDLLTTAEWDEIRIKDAWYRARIKDFFAALALGGTPDGIRKMVKAAISVDAEIYELWRFQDYYAEIYGISDVETQMNLVKNPNFEYGNTWWSTGSTITSVTTPANSIQSGTKSLEFSTGTAITNPSFSTTNLQCSENKTYTVSFYYYAPTISPLATMNIVIRNRNAVDDQISLLTSTTQTLVATTRTRVSYTFTTPALTDHLTVTIRLNGTVTTPATVFYVDAVQITAGSLVGYFDGDTSGYRWTGIAGESPSIKASPVDALSRLKVPSRNEIIIYPHKATISALELQLIKEMVGRVAPVDSIITVKNSGYAVNVPIQTTFTTADSTYFQINSLVEGVNIQGLTEEEEPNATYRWLQNGVETLAPNLAFAESQEYSQYYTFAESEDSSIDSVNYFTESATGTIRPESNYKIIEKSISAWSQWTLFDRADAPDNFPGGKNGLQPMTAPAVNANGSAYIFPYSSQQDYVDQMKAILNNIGGQSRTYKESAIPGDRQVNQALAIQQGLVGIKGEYSDVQYRIPVAATETIINFWTPEEAIANKAPVKASTVTSGWYSRPLGQTNTQFTI